MGRYVHGFLARVVLFALEPIRNFSLQIFCIAFVTVSIDAIPSYKPVCVHAQIQNIPATFGSGSSFVCIGACLCMTWDIFCHCPFHASGLCFGCYSPCPSFPHSPPLPSWLAIPRYSHFPPPHRPGTRAAGGLDEKCVEKHFSAAA